MGNFVKILKWVAAIAGWVWAILEFLLKHPIPPFPH